MSRYQSAAAFRVALETRLANRSTKLGLELERLRRRVVFERILVRLDLDSPGAWVLKGGMALEVRLPDRARTTRDLDVSTRLEHVDRDSLRARVSAALGKDVDGDRFTFEVSQAIGLRPDDAGRPGWRLTVTSRLAGRNFAAVRVDVVARPDEIAATRATHELPEELPAPPKQWRMAYVALAQDLGLRGHTIDEGTLAVRSFWERARATGRATQ